MKRILREKTSRESNVNNIRKLIEKIVFNQELQQFRERVANNKKKGDKGKDGVYIIERIFE